MSMKSPVRLLLAAALVAAAALAGCGGDGGDTEAGEPATLKVGVIPIADCAPLFVGIDQGFFEEEKLKIEPVLAEGGAAITASVVSGDNQIGFSNATSLLIAGSKGLPLQIIAQGVVGGPKPTAKEAWDGLQVPKGSDIERVADLEGKTVAVNNLNNVGPLSINTALKNAGADYRKVEYAELPFPDMNAALKAKRVDAAWMVEPFVAQGLAQGNRTIAYPFEETAPNLTVATYFSSKEYIEQNGDVVDRFVRAINKSLRYSQSHPEVVRRTVPEYTKIPKPVAQKMKMPQWRASLGIPTIETTAKLAQEYGFTKKPADVQALIR